MILRKQLNQYTMETKKIWESKTIWANVFLLVISITGLLTPDTLALIGIHNTAKFIGIMTLVVAVINIILRNGNPAPIDNSVPSGTDYAITPKGREEAKKMK